MEEEKKENRGGLESKVKVTFVDKGEVSDGEEIPQKEMHSTSENKINLPEMILNATDRQLGDKVSIESKAVGYLAFVALMMAIVSELFPNVINVTKKDCPLFCNLSFVLFVLTFVAGIALIITCALVLFPRRISYFQPEVLMELYKDSVGNELCNKIDEILIKGNEKSIPVNVDALKKMRVLNRIASVLLILLVSIFAIDIVVYFVFLGA